MAKAKKEREKNYDPKLAINGSFADVIKVSVSNDPKKSRNMSKEFELKMEDGTIIYVTEIHISEGTKYLFEDPTKVYPTFTNMPDKSPLPDSQISISEKMVIDVFKKQILNKNPA